ncbi:MAG: flagellar basal body-associated FliL family protein [Candidatus Rokubacteria bacterium]|nr:flagellar basal body-associated FliL family protein [Candidatus Rokubacteria bacterium]
MANAPTEATAPPARKKGMLLIALAAVVLLGAGGAVALVGGSGAGEHGGGADPGAESGELAMLPGVVSLDPFVLNLADPEGDRYVRASLRIGLDSAVAAERLSTEALQLARVRDRVLLSLSSKSADEITSFEGKETLRAELKGAISPLFTEARVVDVYFTEFLVQ